MQNVESLKQRASALKTSIVKTAGSADTAKVRRLRKNLKRAQRKARTLAAVAQHVAKRSAKKEKKAEG